MALDLTRYIASIPDYPEKGIVFRDISPLMADGDAYKQATEQIVQFAHDKKVEMIVGPEARGFIIGCPVAYELGVGFAPARKRENCLVKLLKQSMNWNMELLHSICIKMQLNQVNAY